ncbi:unnamed protein product [Anisakis simplex]|uniref:Uncharacterized protein n=1 Tax=Anisakis simplex TaxID=6269 RepID=A0A0M3JYP3_ANISI|nr:unnamed protein product [Anisakis simplex]
MSGCKKRTSADGLEASIFQAIKNVELTLQGSDKRNHVSKVIHTSSAVVTGSSGHYESLEREKNDDDDYLCKQNNFFVSQSSQSSEEHNHKIPFLSSNQQGQQHSSVLTPNQINTNGTQSTKLT